MTGRSTHEVTKRFTVEVDNEVALQEAVFHRMRERFAEASDAARIADGKSLTTEKALETLLSLYANVPTAAQPEVDKFAGGVRLAAIGTT